MKMYKVQNNKLKFGRHDNLNSTMPPPSCQDVGIKDQEELRLPSPASPGSPAGLVESIGNSGGIQNLV